MNRMLSFLLVCGSSSLLGGCFSTVVNSGLEPAQQPSVEYDEKWHSGFIAGIVEVSGPYKLNELCPNGWARIETYTSFLNGLVQAVTHGIYNPQTVTVVCAKPGTGAAEAVSGPGAMTSPPIVSPAVGVAPPTPGTEVPGAPPAQPGPLPATAPLPANVPPQPVAPPVK